ncbi:MAG: ABC transporter permease [Clostridiales bacterium]|nr:ABC transporter permease [Clostridiales bacterium]
MIFRCFLRSLRDVGKDFLRNPIYSIITAFTIFATLFFLSVVFILVSNANSIMSDIEGRMELVVYFYDEADAQSIQAFQTDIIKIEGVDSIEYLSKEDALNKMKEEWAEYSYLLDEFNSSNNPLPRSLIIYASDADSIVRIEEFIYEADDIVESFDSYKQIADLLKKVSNVIKYGGIGIVIVLALICMLVISNTVRLSIHAKRVQLDIMRSVGAANWYIRLPFVMQSFIIGLIASIGASMLAVNIYSRLTANISIEDILLFSGILPAGNITGIVYISCISIGCIFCLVTSFFSTNRYLRK